MRVYYPINYSGNLQHVKIEDQDAPLRHHFAEHSSEQARNRYNPIHRCGCCHSGSRQGCQGHGRRC